jgi:hypothetical protein
VFPAAGVRPLGTMKFNSVESMDKKNDGGNIGIVVVATLKKSTSVVE